MSNSEGEESPRLTNSEEEESPRLTNSEGEEYTGIDSSKLQLNGDYYNISLVHNDKGTEIADKFSVEIIDQESLEIGDKICPAIANLKDAQTKEFINKRAEILDKDPAPEYNGNKRGEGGAEKTEGITKQEEEDMPKEKGIPNNKEEDTKKDDGIYKKIKIPKEREEITEKKAEISKELEGILEEHAISKDKETLVPGVSSWRSEEVSLKNGLNEMSSLSMVNISLDSDENTRMEVGTVGLNTNAGTNKELVEEIGEISEIKSLDDEDVRHRNGSGSTLSQEAASEELRRAAFSTMEENRAAFNAVDHNRSALTSGEEKKTAFNALALDKNGTQTAPTAVEANKTVLIASADDKIVGNQNRINFTSMEENRIAFNAVDQNRSAVDSRTACNTADEDRTGFAAMDENRNGIARKKEVQQLGTDGKNSAVAAGGQLLFRFYCSSGYILLSA